MNRFPAHRFNGEHAHMDVDDADDEVVRSVSEGLIARGDTRRLDNPKRIDLAGVVDRNIL